MLINSNKHPYKVVSVLHTNGCKTKFKPGRYESRSPAEAAKKAGSQLCSHKEIHGRCSLIISLERTDMPNNKQTQRKTYHYEVHKKKLDKPKKVKIKNKIIIYKYNMTAKRIYKLPKCSDKSHTQSRGIMKVHRR